MHLYHEQFLDSNDFLSSVQTKKVLIIASTGRSGSHMFGHALWKTNKFGFPLEYVNPANLTEWKKRLGSDDVLEVLNKLKRKRTSDNGVFAIKLHYPHLTEIGGIDKLKEIFPDAYYILLHRKDVLKQAVSLSIAKQTGVWISGQKAINEKASYNRKQIEACLKETIINNSSWKYALSANGCKFIEMDFDNVRNNLAESILEVANFMDVDICHSEIPSEHVTKQQSNPINAEWAKTFTSEHDASNNLLSGFFKRLLIQNIKRILKVLRRRFRFF